MLSKKSTYILIVTSFLISVLFTNYYLSKHDKYELSSDNFENHSMIKGDILKFWIEADIIKNQIENGKSLFGAGEEFRNQILISRSIAIYSSLTNYNLYNNETGKISIEKGKKLYFIIQAILYYLSLVFFYKQIVKMYPINNCFFIICFLALEPTLLTFHSSFWTESFFFTLQIFSLTLIFKSSRKIFFNLFLGICLGLLLLQRTISIYYFLIVIFYYLFLFKKKSLKPILFLLIGYALIIMFIGLQNQKRIGIFYVMPKQSMVGFYDYMLPFVISNKEKISLSESKDKLKNQAEEWVNTNNLSRNSEKDLRKIYKYKQKKAFEIMIDEPKITFFHVMKKLGHFLILDPLSHVHYFYKFEYKGSPEKRYYKSETQQNLIPYRIIYTLIIYLVTFFGLIFLFKRRDKNTIFILSISIMYFILASGWIGNTRYFSPCLIYLSIFFGNGMGVLCSKKKTI